MDLPVDAQLDTTETAFIIRVTGGDIRLNNADCAEEFEILDAQAIEPGTAMPNLGVSEGQARSIAAYLYTLR